MRRIAHSAYTHNRVKNSTGITVKIATKITGQTGFVVLPRRWVFERVFVFASTEIGTWQRMSKRSSCS